VAEVADGAHRLELAVREHRQARRVITPVLEPLQAGEDDLASRPLAYIADDSAHVSLRNSTGPQCRGPAHAEF
jgi:hypothetical protein